MAFPGSKVERSNLSEGGEGKGREQKEKGVRVGGRERKREKDREIKGWWEGGRRDKKVEGVWEMVDGKTII